MTLRSDDAQRQQQAKNLRLALILASVALVFFIGFIVNTVLHKG